MNCLDRCYQKDPNIVSRKIANEVILVPIRNNVGDLESIYTLNEVAARIWELIDGNRKVSEIKRMITEEFDVTPEQADIDIFEFLKQMERAGGIRV